MESFAVVAVCCVVGELIEKKRGVSLINNVAMVDWLPKPTDEKTKNSCKIIIVYL